MNCSMPFVCMCIPVSIIAMGRYVILCFFLLFGWKRKTQKKIYEENSGQKYNKILCYIYKCVYMYYNTIKKQNGNECTELEGGLNATH